MRLVFLAGICAAFITTILWYHGFFGGNPRKPNLLEEHKKLSGSIDFVGTLWQNGEGKNAIYFLAPDTLVYSSFSPDIYDDQARRRLRSECLYRYNPDFRIFTIPRLGVQYDVSMKVTIDSVKNEIYLDDLENFQRWFQETKSTLAGKAR